MHVPFSLFRTQSDPEMHFSIITPSFRNSDWLKLCIASVADQGVSLEHIIQDAGSDDGTLDWLPGDKRVKAFIERDSGMYDAINRGIKRAEGDILAYLNCDEQYLPGALAAVQKYFVEHPDTDILFADALVIDAVGDYICSRQVQIPNKYHTWTVHLGTLTCATFFRRRVVDEGLLFNPSFRYIGDGEWVLNAIGMGFRMRILRCFTSAFTETGVNLTLNSAVEEEKLKLHNSAPAWVLKLRPMWIAHHRIRRLVSGAYLPKSPFQYSIFTRKDPSQRRVYEVEKPTFRWVWRCAGKIT